STSEGNGVNKLALTMCTLLSSQGPDAPSFFSLEGMPARATSVLYHYFSGGLSTGFIGVGGPA
ncbi:hypothetical protein ACO0E1_18790, partial [Curtobacterium sp. RRHDQ66]|uniref:hypothetical protein n=1 Tax=Curtobacterium guangdongense TaxID=3413380 RepID=UPI003BF3A11C